MPTQQRSAFGFIARLARCDDTQTLWSLLCERMTDYGFDRLLYGITRLHHGDLADPEGWLVFGTHDEAYKRRLFEDGLLRGARMADWAFDNSGTLLWSRYDELPPADPSVEFRLRALRRAHAIRAGALFSFPPLPHRTRGLLSLTARRGLDQSLVDNLWQELGEEIEAQLQVFHQRFLSLPFGPYRLTQRQKQVLELVARGLTAQEMATRLDLTPATIDKHLRLAREVLGVSTTAQAVLKASLFNQILD